MNGSTEAGVFLSCFSPVLTIVRPHKVTIFGYRIAISGTWISLGLDASTLAWMYSLNFPSITASFPVALCVIMYAAQSKLLLIPVYQEGAMAYILYRRL